MPLELVRLNLLDLNGNYAVLSSAFEELNVCTVGGGLNVLFLGTSVEEEVNNGLYTLLGELLIALCRTGLLVCVTIDCELGVGVDNRVGEVLEVSFLTL